MSAYFLMFIILLIFVGIIIIELSSLFIIFGQNLRYFACATALFNTLATSKP